MYRSARTTAPAWRAGRTPDRSAALCRRCALLFGGRLLGCRSLCGGGHCDRCLGGCPAVPNPIPPEAHALVALTPFLLLRAFSSGATALTGVEAISNGITTSTVPLSDS